MNDGWKLTQKAGLIELQQQLIVLETRLQMCVCNYFRHPDDNRQFLSPVRKHALRDFKQCFIVIIFTHITFLIENLYKLCIW